MLTRYNYTLINYSGVGLPDYLPSAISSADAKTLTWNSEGRLSRVKLGNRLNVDMTYDASGLRTSKTYNNVVHEYTYDDGRLITEKIGNLTMVFLYDESNNVDCIWYNGDKYYLIRNTFGDVVQLRDESNQVVAYYKYNAFGYLLSVTDANGAEITDTSHIAHLNPIRYRGYYYDTELKMYYLYSRYYNPEMCRFISADVVVGTSLAGTNLFAYCGNDPINFIDPYGYCFARTDCICNTKDDKDGGCRCGDPCDFQLFPPEEQLQPLPEVEQPGANNTQNSGASSGGASNTGWRLGADITALTKAGNKPSWTTVRQRYWKNEAYYNGGSYSDNDKSRMQKGLAPQVEHNGQLYSMELHHETPRHQGGTDEYSNLRPVTPWEHDEIDKFRHFVP